MASRDISLKRLKHYWPLYFFVLPSALLVATFSYYPAVSAMYHSFFRWNGEDISIFIGTANFKRVLGNYWLWIAVLLGFAGILYTSKAKTSKSDFFRIGASIFFLIASAGTMGVKGLLFDPRVMISQQGNALAALNIQEAGTKLGIGITVWGTLLMLAYLFISGENRSKWVYLLAPASFIAVSFLQALGFNAVFAWSIVMLVIGFAIWVVPAVEKLGNIENFRTFHAFASLGICIWALAKFAGGDPVLWSGFTVIGILICFNIVKMIPSVVTAVVIHRLNSDSANYWYRVLFVIPMIIPGMVGLLIWKFFFNPNEGLFNRILVSTRIMDVLYWFDGVMGWDGSVFQRGEMPVWLGNPNLVLPAFILWGFPWIGIVGVLIYLAGLQAIPDTVYEAAKLDGATSLQKFFHIEFPLILTQIRINLVLLVIGTLQTYAFILILFGDDGGPNGKLMVPGLFMFRSAFREAMAGYACSIGLVIFFFILILTEINNRYVRTEK
ncbi:MAG: sugar ABC transporter permease [Victivallales bacterium]|nr:sugar ABC transporter permease [Victivallales bacterium]